MPYKYGLDSPVEWAQVGITPVRGLCPYISETGGLDNGGGCYYCYMKTMFKRFRNSKKPLDQTLRRDISDIYWIPPKPLKVAVCLNLDLFHPSVPDKWKREILDWSALQGTQAIRIYLTKSPQEYQRFRFPPNSWLGTTWDGLPYTEGNIDFLARTTDSNSHCLKFVSFEPLLERLPEGFLDPYKGLIQWVIIGFDSRRGVERPPLWWVSELIEQAHHNDMAVWVKDNTGHSASLTTKEYPMPFSEEEIYFED